MTTKYSLIDVFNDLSELQATGFTVDEKDVVIRRIMRKIDKSQMWKDEEKRDEAHEEIKDDIKYMINILRRIRDNL